MVLLVSSSDQVRISDVLVAVSRRFDVTPDLLRGPRRARHVSWPRQLAYLVAVNLCPHLSLQQISHQIGGRDHTTILHGLKRARERMSHDEGLSRKAAEIEAELRESYPHLSRYPLTSPQVDDMRAI